MNCPNCNATLTCNCQRRTAGNGKQCCSNCINSCNTASGTPNIPKQRPATTPKSPYAPHP